MIWFTADHHFDHANIIKYTKRPFSAVDEMNQIMVKRWNERVQADDTVIHLGDFTLGNAIVAQRFFSQVNGRIAILCNPLHHDKRWIKTPQFSKSGIVKLISPLKTLEIPSGKYPAVIVLSHFPLAEWDRKHYNSIHLHAHSHGTHRGEGRILDVGVDCHNFYPISLSEVLERFK
jgi:calcineurin-like phosphoesterase family protein